jgi:excisionase family DNA binding protein
MSKSNLMNTTALPPSGSFEAHSPAADLVDLIGPRLTFKQIAAALGCTERAIYNLVDEHKIPFIRVLSVRYVDPADFRSALTRAQNNAPARGRGRPRKAA